MTSIHWRQTGGIWPMGVSTSLTWYDVGALLTLIPSFGVRCVLEIGVEHGGLAALLLAYSTHTGIVYRGIDISLASLAHTVRGQASIVERDAWAQATVDEVARWLAEMPAPALIICDGGDKPKELRLYAPLLRTGDIIVGHDYHNEYVDDALTGLPADLVRIRADWLDDTLLCAFLRGAL